MAGNAARRARRQTSEDVDFDDEDDDQPEEEAPSRSRSGRPALPLRFLAWCNQGNAESSSMRMEGRDELGAYAAALVLVAIPFICIVANATHHGTALPSPIYQAVGVLLGLLTAISIRLRNRVITPLCGILSVLFTSTRVSAIPKDIRYIADVDLYVGLALVIVLTMRQTRMRSVQTAERRASQRAAKGGTRSATTRSAGTRGRGKKAEPEPTGPAQSRRYTPPKNRSSA